MTVTSPYEAAADVLKTIIDGAFSTEGWVAEHDTLHPSLGEEATRIGIAPDADTPRSNNYVMNEIRMMVQFLGQYELDVDPEQAVDPRIVTRYAERFRRACQADDTPGDQHFWFFNIERITYPNDPSGNKTRFYATVCAYTQNSGIIETAG